MLLLKVADAGTSFAHICRCRCLVCAHFLPLLRMLQVSLLPVSVRLRGRSCRCDFSRVSVSMACWCPALPISYRTAGVSAGRPPRDGRGVRQRPQLLPHGPRPGTSMTWPLSLTSPSHPSLPPLTFTSARHVHDMAPLSRLPLTPLFRLSLSPRPGTSQQPVLS